MNQVNPRPQCITRSSVGSTVRDVGMRRAWWFTATARTRARFARTFFGSFWLGLSNLLSIAALALVYGTVFKVQDFNTYVVYLGIGLVVWNGISAAIGSAPNLFEHNHSHVHNTNLNPIFFVLEEWAFQVQTFLQSFALVVLLELVPTQSVAQSIGLRLVPVAEPVLVLILGAHDCLPLGCSLPRLLSACSNCFAVSIPPLSDSISQR